MPSLNRLKLDLSSGEGIYSDPFDFIDYESMLSFVFSTVNRLLNT